MGISAYSQVAQPDPDISAILGDLGFPLQNDIINAEQYTDAESFILNGSGLLANLLIRLTSLIQDMQKAVLDKDPAVQNPVFQQLYQDLTTELVPGYGTIEQDCDDPGAQDINLANLLVDMNQTPSSSHGTVLQGLLSDIQTFVLTFQPT